MQLTQHFSLNEMVFSETAVRKGIDNTPDDDCKDNLYSTATGMERVRKVLGGYPITITSGYRSPKLNTAIGGSKNSKHMLGLACDFICPDAGTPRDVCLILSRHKDDIGFDQLIMEGNWTHVSFPAFLCEPKLEVLTAVFAGGGVTYIKGIA